MPLPKVDRGPLPPGADPNQKTRQTDASPGIFKTWASSMVTNVSENLSPSNFIRQGTYSAFGNNVVTRGAMGAMDSTFDAIEQLITGKRDDQDRDTHTDKLIKEQIKIATESNSILKDLLETMTAFQHAISDLNKPIGPDVSDLHDLNEDDETDPRYKKTKQDRVDDTSPVFDLLKDVASDVVDIKYILSDGFDRIRETFEHAYSNVDRVEDDIEDAVIIKETEYSKKRDLVLAKHNIDVEKLLKSIAYNSDKTVKLLSSGPLSTAESDAESSRRVKHMGPVEEVQPRLEGPKPEDMDAENATLLGLLSGALAYFFDKLVSGVKNLAGSVVDLVKKGLSSIGEALSKSWDFLKKGAESIVDGAKKAWEGVIDFGKGVIEKGKNLADDVAAKIPTAVKELPEKIMSKAGSLVDDAAKLGAKATKFIPGMGLLATAGFTAYDSYDAYNNAESILDIKGRDASFAEKASAGFGGAVDSLTFGLIGKEDTAKWVNGLVSSGSNKRDALTKSHLEATAPAAIAPAAAAGAPSTISNTTNNSYYSGKKPTHNEDQSFNRYMDKHYAF